MLPDKDAQSSKPVSDVKTINTIIQQMEDIELQTEPPEDGKESTNLPDDDAENLVGGVRYPTIQIIQTFT